jgi:PhoPQ-activated pathogenicity-related protein
MSQLQEYVQADVPCSWDVVRKGRKTSTLHLKGLEWQGIEWTHDIVLVDPETKGRTDSAILYITGGDPNPLDIGEAEFLAKESGMPVALLFHIPNQPLFDLWEDDLIAHTFVQFLETGDATWPLLLPMTRSAIKAMDALQAFRPKLSKFMVTGGSKRGWTSWLTAATEDQRVAGIAPMVYDNLNIPAQLRHQMELWGGTSEMIEPYTALGLHESVGSDAGAKLVSLVDPFSYRDRLAIPKLIVNGANDHYWTVDA